MRAFSIQRSAQFWRGLRTPPVFRPKVSKIPIPKATVDSLSETYAFPRLLGAAVVRPQPSTFAKASEDASRGAAGHAREYDTTAWKTNRNARSLHGGRGVR